MKIHNTSASSRQAFTGKYIVKGRVEDLIKYSIFRKSIFLDMEHPYCERVKNYESWFDYEEHALIPYFDEKQDYAELLCATNEDATVLRKFIANNIDFPKIDPETITVDDLINYVNNLSKMVKAQIDPYKFALKRGGNTFADFMIDAYQKGRAELVKIFGKDEAKNIPELNVSDILKAIKPRKFDFVEGEIFE